jgi:hypothetical protein
VGLLRYVLVGAVGEGTLPEPRHAENHAKLSGDIATSQFLVNDLEGQWAVEVNDRSVPGPTLKGSTASCRVFPLTETVTSGP